MKVKEAIVRIKQMPCFTDLEDKVQAMAIDSMKRDIVIPPIYEIDCKNIYGAKKRECQVCGDVVMISPQAEEFENFCRRCGRRLKDYT